MLEKYITELDADMKLDIFNIKDVQLKLPSIKHKWVGRCIRHKQELIRLSAAREAKKRGLVTELQQTSLVKLADVVAERTAENLSDLKEFDQKMSELKLVIELLEKTEKTLSSMTYDIGNCIKLMTLEQT